MILTSPISLTSPAHREEEGYNGAALLAALWDCGSEDKGILQSLARAAAGQPVPPAQPSNGKGGATRLLPPVRAVGGEL